jgi:curved DNA-binding protein CbpA
MESSLTGGVDPYKLFRFNRGIPFTRDELKAKAKELVLVTHPDKPGGSERKFQIVMECYKFLSEALREFERMSVTVNEDAVRRHREERTSGKEEFEIPSYNYNRFTSRKEADSRKKVNTREGGEGEGEASAHFDVKAFNKFFEENRLDNSLSKGHGDWLKSPDPSRESATSRSIEKGRFQEEFEKERQRLLKEKRIVRHTGGPQGVSLKSSRVAGSSLDDFDSGGGTLKCSNGVMGVDLREALEVGIIAVDDPRYTGDSTSAPVSLEDAKRLRSQARMTLTAEEEREMMEAKRIQEAQDRERQARILARNRQINEHFQRVNHLLGDK